MNLKPVKINIEEYPVQIQPYLHSAALYDSSCSENARVLYIDKEKGYFLKSASVGSLGRENDLTRFFNRKGLAPTVVEYVSDGKRDILLTEKVKGDDCIAAKYLKDPKRLCDTLGSVLAMLHAEEYTDCPIADHTGLYRTTVEQNYKAHCYDMTYCGIKGIETPDEAYRYVKNNIHLLKNDTLLHGDYCLPNVILDNWNFSAFVDVGNGGVGDRHVDLFWGAWALQYNLGTDKYRERFFDAYGRDKIDDERLMLIGACEVFG